MILSELLHKIPVLETFGNLAMSKEVSKSFSIAEKLPKVRFMLL